ncbi:MAG: GNAT family N-acetyltransferase [Solirubrobacteraceae bacterium]
MKVDRALARLLEGRRLDARAERVLFAMVANRNRGSVSFSGLRPPRVEARWRGIAIGAAGVCTIAVRQFRRVQSDVPDPVVRELAAGEIELVAPLWRALQEHHAQITPALGHAPARDAAESWRRRRGKYERWLEQPDTLVAVAERVGHPVGYAFVTVGPGFASWASGERIAELETLSVLPTEQGRGIGTLLLDFVAGTLAEIGIEELTVTSATTNTDSHRFYERRGLQAAFVVFFGRLGGSSSSGSGGEHAPASASPAPVGGLGSGREPGAVPASENAASGGVLGLDHVLVAAPQGCEPAARRFYGELLGLGEVPRPESLRVRGGAWFTLGAQQVHVGVEDAFSAARKAHPALRVADGALDALAERLSSAGVPVKWDTRLPGVRRFYVEDPWGNRLELVEAT